LFELYSTGNYSIIELQDWLAEKNILSRNGTTLGHSVIDTILNNPFYYGLARWHGVSKMGNTNPLSRKSFMMFANIPLENIAVSFYADAFMIFF